MLMHIGDFLRITVKLFQFLKKYFPVGCRRLVTPLNLFINRNIFPSFFPQHREGL